MWTGPNKITLKWRGLKISIFHSSWKLSIWSRTKGLVRTSHFISLFTAVTNLEIPPMTEKSRLKHPSFLNCPWRRVYWNQIGLTQRVLSSVLSGWQNDIALLSLSLSCSLSDVLNQRALQNSSSTLISCGSAGLPHSCLAIQHWWCVTGHFSSLFSAWLIYFIACSQLYSSPWHHALLKTMNVIQMHGPL